MATEGIMTSRMLLRSAIRSQVPVGTRCFSASSRLAGNSLDNVESNSSMTTPLPTDEIIQKFQKRRAASPEQPKQLPGKRFQYHPPKYDRGPLHPVQSPEATDPISRNFLPGPFNHPRLLETYQHTISSDILTLAYQHTIPGTPAKPERERLRSWDDSSPYHANRPLRGPRGTSNLTLIEKGIKFNNIPEITSIHLHIFQPQATQDPGYLAVARAVMMAISGRMPKVTWIKNQVSQWKIKQGELCGCKTDIFGHQAYEFLDKLVTVVFPKIKDWPGIVGKGNGSGDIMWGLNPSDMAHFPEIGINYDMYPSKMIPGMHITVRTSANSDRQARLLMQTMGVHMTGKF